MALFFLRIGNNTTKDPYFESDYAKAKNAGLRVGCYFYATKTTIADAKNDANRVVGWLGGKALDFPVAYDMEETSMKSASRKDTNSQQYNAFAEIISSKGYVPILYTGASMFKSYFNKDLINDNIWIASYGSNDGNNHGTPSVGKTVAIHQYTSEAISSDFYSSKLDRNVLLISYTELMKKHSEASETSTQSSQNKTNSVIKAGQQHSINFTGHTIGVDGISGAETKKQKVRVLQRAINLDYGNSIAEDGIWGTKSNAKLGSHYVKKGEKQYMVTALQICLMLNGIDPNGVELPGVYGNGVVNAAKQFFGDDGLKVTAAEFLKLIN